MNKVSVVIGRFQPYHNGHQHLLREAAKHADCLIVLVGSTNLARTPKNPIPVSDICRIISDDVKSWFTGRVSIMPINDYMYSDERWRAGVLSSVDTAIDLWHSDDPEVTLFGFEKDASSYYLKMFPQWKYTAVEPWYIDNRIMSATDIREQLFSEEVVEEEYFGLMPDCVYDYLDQFVQTYDYHRLYQEYQFIKAYKKQFESLPYPPVFVTGDAVVFCNGSVLLVKRRANPGKGLYALPGGFIDEKESVKQCILRELKEETRIKVPQDVLSSSLRLVRVYDHPNRSLRGRTITHAGLITLEDHRGMPKVRGGDDAERAKWVPIADAMNMQTELFEDHYHIIMDMLGRV